MTEQRPLTVSELTGRIKSTLEGAFTDISVTGEVSNFKIHTSGHCYFTIKDEQAQLQAVMWRSRVSRLFFSPENGMKVVARGNVTVYPVRGVYQIDVISLQPAGVGELQAAFERLKKKLFEEGLFDERSKVPLPEYPARIGIVTSPTGAAIRDMVQIFRRRAPYVELVLRPVQVQGSGAARDIATAIEDFNEYGNVDVIIVGRGGGSIEDLWAFNEECVARAIFESEIPIVSAVGHEVDYTISDFVSDLRAPTPSAAAELSVRSRDEIVENLSNIYYTVKQITETIISRYRERIQGYLRSYAFNLPADLIRQRTQRLDELLNSLVRVTAHRTEVLRERLISLSGRIRNLDPVRILERGYVIVYRRGGRALASAASVHPGDMLDLRFHDGSITGKAIGKTTRGTAAGGTDRQQDDHGEKDR